jgi:AcrR family transcriptional regulator
VLDCAADLLAGPDGMAVSIDAIAQAAVVSKHTIYRWWPSKGAALLEAMVERAQKEVTIPDTGAFATDLEAFLADTFRAVEQVAPLLRGLMAEALRDTVAAQGMREFITARRNELRGLLVRGLLVRGLDRGELPAETDLELTMDQIYGLMWYRLLIARSPITGEVAIQLSRAVIGRSWPSGVSAAGRQPPRIGYLPGTARPVS